MEILNSPIENFDFEKVVAFCKEGIPEGIQIDYKKDFPPKGFAKHFAAFSNSRGGAIIIGVEEDKKSGLPIAWEGVVRDAKQIEKIHQDACNVDPVPSYDVHITDEVEGKCFVIIRIYEGNKTPYYVQNDFNIWTRTGNVSNPIDIASPDGLALLFGKKEKAEKARDIHLKMAEDAYLAGLEREEARRLKELQEMEKNGGSTEYHYKKKLGSEAAMCRIAIQPYYPAKAVASPREIKSELDSLRTGRGRFPDYNMETMPGGLLNFSRGMGGYIECQQIFGSGLLQLDFDAVRTDQNGKKIINIWPIATNLFVVFEFAKKLYSKFGYQGAIDGNISLNDANNTHINQLKPSNRHFWSDDKKSFLQQYQWHVQLDTSILNNATELKAYYISLLGEIYWSLGYEDIREDVVDDFLKESGLAF